MTRDERLASIRQRATAASDGPRAVGRVDHGDDTAPVVRPDGKTIIEVSTWAGKGVVDAAFVANARFDIPFLLDELDVAKARVQQMRRFITSHYIRRDETCFDGHMSQWTLCDICLAEVAGGKTLVHRPTCPLFTEGEQTVPHRTTALSDRVRPNVEVAPWVVDAIMRLENELGTAKEKLADYEVAVKYPGDDQRHRGASVASQLVHAQHMREQAEAERDEALAHNAKLTERVQRLTAALNGVLPFVATQRMACGGMKCRETWCESCYGDDDAEASANVGRACADEARVALAEGEDTP